MDYGKYRYTQRKKAAESRKKATRVVVKEVKLGSQTDDHDVAFKVNHIRRFLDEGMRVKVSVFFRGRAITHPEKGKEMLDLVMSKIEDVATQELKPRLEGRSMSMMVVPK
jgi:translation initiation factor IF-3